MHSLEAPHLSNYSNDYHRKFAYLLRSVFSVQPSAQNKVFFVDHRSMSLVRTSTNDTKFGIFIERLLLLAVRIPFLHRIFNRYSAKKSLSNVVSLAPKIQCLDA